MRIASLMIVASAPLLLSTPAIALAADATPAVVIDDQADLLTPAQEQALSTDTSKVALPASVHEVLYVTFAKNDKNLNDTVRFYTGEKNLHNTAGDKYADGLLVVAVGMDPHGMGVYCGDDVCRDTQIYNAKDKTDDLRVSAIMDSMRPLLKDENWEAGMLRGVQAAADTSVRNKPSHTGLIAGIVGGILALGAGIFVFFAGRDARKDKIKRARKDYEYIVANHGDIAQRLEAIDVRAHSLSSPLADASLRQQWDNLRESFLKAHNTMDSLGELDFKSDDKKFAAKAGALSKAREAVTRTATAEKQIEQLAQLEHGNATARSNALTKLHEDVLKAISTANSADTLLAGQLQELDGRILQLRNAPAQEGFMDSFANILSDYRVLLNSLQQQMYSESNIKPKKHDTAELGQTGWTPGIGTYYVPFYTMNSWHSADVREHQQSTSGSTNTGYSAGGFSGGGGSSSF